MYSGLPQTNLLTSFVSKTDNVLPTLRTFVLGKLFEFLKTSSTKYFPTTAYLLWKFWQQTSRSDKEDHQEEGPRTDGHSLFDSQHYSMPLAELMSYDYRGLPVTFLLSPPLDLCSLEIGNGRTRKRETRNEK